MNKKIKIVFVALVFIVITLLFLRFWGSEDKWICDDNQWVKHGNPSSLQPKTICGESVVGVDINFDETGHFVKDNPGLKPGVWYLVYEKPGAPALIAELVFDDKSICTWGDVKGACPEVFFPRSSLTRVRGTLMQNGAVRVINAN